MPETFISRFPLSLFWFWKKSLALHLSTGKMFQDNKDSEKTLTGTGASAVAISQERRPAAKKTSPGECPVAGCGNQSRCFTHILHPVEPN
jgi:hypothetical protein